MMLFAPDFKYKVDSLNLYIIDNYVKRTTVFPRFSRGAYRFSKFLVERLIEQGRLSKLMKI